MTPAGRFLLQLVAVPGVLGCGACAFEVGGPTENTTGMASPDYSIYVEETPPSPRDEVIGIAPGSTYVWIGGYWTRQGTSWTWMEGRWTERPRPDAEWVPGRWDRHARGHVWISGRWR
jgi:hypothetical protein